MIEFYGDVGGETVAVDLRRIVGLTPPNLRRVSGSASAYAALGRLVEALYDADNWREDESRYASDSDDDERSRVYYTAYDRLRALMFRELGAVLEFLSDTMAFRQGLDAGMRMLWISSVYPNSTEVTSAVVALKTAIDSAFMLLRAEGDE